MSPEIKEIVMDTDLLYMKHLLPNSSNGAFHLGPGCHISCFQLLGEILWHRQCLAVYLAVRSER